MSKEFGKTIAAAYAADGPTVDLGRGVHEGALAPEAVVQIPLRMMNRHGLVAGATGTLGRPAQLPDDRRAAVRLPAWPCSPPT